MKAKIEVDKLETRDQKIEGLKITVGRVIAEELEEPEGPTLFPKISDLREWDMRLLERFPPFYAPACTLCCLCTYGKCDLSDDKQGACGLNLMAQQGRIVMIACAIGSACHTAHGKHLTTDLIEKYGPDAPIYLGPGVEVEAPHTRLVTGLKVTTLRDLEDVLDYCNNEIVNILAAAHTGQEGSYLDFESKSLHVSMIDHVALEIADIAQVAAIASFPKAAPEAPLVELGLGTIDNEKPMILVIGHNVIPSTGIIEYMEIHGLMDKVEIAGICCTAHDTTRLTPKAKVVGSIGQQLRFVRTGRPDLIVIDEQCIRTDIVEEAQKVGTPVIATTDKSCRELPDRTKDEAEGIIDDLINYRAPGALILDIEKVGEVAVETAKRIRPQRKQKNLSRIPLVEEIQKIVKDCTQCRECQRNCPQDLDISEAMVLAKKGDLSGFDQLVESCIACGRCETACSKHLPILNMILSVSTEKFAEERAMMRTGRGAVSDAEIRNVGAPIVFGEIPGIIAIVGCANYPEPGPYKLGLVAKEFLDRNFIVVVSGCGAMDICYYKTEEGKSLYEEYPGDFDAGGLVNVGSCVANAHITGAAIKVASIFARRNLKGNYEEIADYILNRVGAVGVAWGAYSQKAASIATGCNRLGVPVIIGPHGWMYRRMYIGDPDKRENWMVYDAKTGEEVYVGPNPASLLYVAESYEELIVMIARMCIRPNDLYKGRSIKISHYWELHEKYLGGPPDDVHLLVRDERDVPITLKDEIMPILKEKGWKPTRIPDPTLVPRLIREKKEK
ncbi:MAG: CO dehydrogenase/acetyl-CoA synthase complex subunit alpha [Candidatus Hermodarchaeota archaeon]